MMTMISPRMGAVLEKIKSSLWVLEEVAWLGSHHVGGLDFHPHFAVNIRG